MTLGRPEPRRYTRSEDRPEVLDLGARWLDVRRIARTTPQWRWCIAVGWDPDDLTQELYARVLARQGMRGRYNPERACVSKYLHVLCVGILSNLAVSVRLLGHPNEVLSDDGYVDAEGPNGLDLDDTLDW
jgi:hypothetical protein